MRLNVFLARAGIASRRASDQLIKSGRVTVNDGRGQLNTVVADNDIVKLDGRPVKTQKLRYILLNKPAGYVTTLRDPQGRRKVTDLIDIEERIVPVGRLDYDTTGALLLTNDGDLANRLMHPRHEVDKVYVALIKGTITGEMLSKLSNGIIIDGDITSPAKVKQIASHEIELTIHEGRKHQVKKMLKAVGLEIVKLHRSKYAGLSLKSLKTGQWRELSTDEIAKLR